MSREIEAIGDKAVNNRWGETGVHTEIPSTEQQQILTKDKITPYTTSKISSAPLTPFAGNVDKLMGIERKMVTPVIESEETNQFLGFFKWVWNYLTENPTTINEESPIPLTEEQKEQIREIYLEIKKIMTQSLDDDDDDDKNLTIEQRRLKAFDKSELQAKTRSEFLVEEFQSTKERVQKNRDKQIKTLDEILEAASHKSSWNKLGLLSAPLLTAFTALSATLPPGAAVVVVGSCAILAIDELSGNHGKSFIADVIVNDDLEQKKLWEERLELLSFFISLGLSVPLTAGVSSLPVAVHAMRTSVTLGLTAIKTTGALGQISSNQIIQTNQSKLTLMKQDAEKWNRKLNEQAGKLKETNKHSHDNRKQVINAENTLTETVQSIFN
ncbi:hypothetical protein N9Y92_01520 [Chlamydiales bacterium]|nr:hypothetical protein [Chlamydiales bacterium]